jgi:diguanylate cyclase (GGDEF)-like protein
LPETPAAEAMRIAEKLRRLVEELAIPHPESTTASHVTVSAGVASLDGAATRAVGLDPAWLLERADEALYRAKRNGRNRVVASETAPPPAAGKGRHLKLAGAAGVRA